MSKNKMLFKALEIKYEGYSPPKLVGRVQFRSDIAHVYLDITEAHCQAIMDMCADALLDAAKDMSDVMRGDIIEGMSLEKKSLISPPKKGFFK